MSTNTDLIDVEEQAGATVLVARHDLGELEFTGIMKELRAVAADPTVRRVVVDLGRTDYLGSTALGMLAQLDEAVSRRGGRLAFCNVSPHDREVFAVVGLTDFWPTFATREQALLAVTA